MSNVIGDNSAHCTNTLATHCVSVWVSVCVLHKYLQHILQSLQVAQWHLTTLKPQFTNAQLATHWDRASSSSLKYIRQGVAGADTGRDTGWAGSAGGKRHVLTMFITVKYLHCRHKCNFMVCHFQPSCSQRTSASTFPQPQHPSVPPSAPSLPSAPRRIFVILWAKHLQVDFDIPFAPDAALNAVLQSSTG